MSRLFCKPSPGRVAEDAANLDEERRTADVRARARRLTPRETDVFALVVTGLLNKQIAGELGIGEKTVKVHRARVMQKMRAGSLAELVHLADRAGVMPRVGLQSARVGLQSAVV